MSDSNRYELVAAEWDDGEFVMYIRPRDGDGSDHLFTHRFNPLDAVEIAQTVMAKAVEAIGGRSA